jgi:2-polyprenyl-3-methyl-5-hydroxy-6-metoxy-1,4-benzoquinol methylase
MPDELADRFGFGPAFAEEWLRQWGRDLSAELAADPGTVEDLWSDFALTANLRGREMAIDMALRLSRFLPSLRGRRALDVGCGFGGSAVAMAELGAAVHGLDLDDGRIRLAAANARDHGVTVTFSRDDLLDSEVRQRLGRFDAIVAEDVLEHVADAKAATRALADLLAAGGLARVTIPNGDAASLVIADAHYLLPGLTLLRDRDDAAAYFESRFDWGEYDVGNYHSYDDYRGWFAEAGFTVLGVDDVEPIQPDALDAEVGAAQRAVATAAIDESLPDRVRNALLAGWRDYEQRVERARSHQGAETMLRIGTRFWRFYLSAGPVERRWSLRRPPRWARRAVLKRIPGAVKVARALRR